MVVFEQYLSTLIFVVHFLYTYRKFIYIYYNMYNGWPLWYSFFSILAFAQWRWNSLIELPHAGSDDRARMHNKSSGEDWFSLFFRISVTTLMVLNRNTSRMLCTEKVCVVKVFQRKNIITNQIKIYLVYVKF